MTDTYLQPKDLDDAAQMIRTLERKCETHRRTAERLGLDVIRNRFEQGRIASQALSAGGHGDGVLNKIAEKAGMNYQTLRHCHLLFKRAGTREAFHEQLKRWEDAHASISWNLCVNWAKDALPAGKEKAEEAVNRRLKRIEVRTRNITDDLIELKEDVEKWTPERRDELLGLATILVETIEDVQTVQVEGLPLPRPTRTIDHAYLAYVRGLPCANCGSAAPSEPHHVEAGGMGTKTTDLFTIPTCRACHREIHSVGPAAFWNGHDVWQTVARTLSGYMTRK